MELIEEQIFRFADVEVDVRRGCLRRGADERHLRQKSFQVLVYLLERRERLVTKDELIEIIWKDTAVTDDALVQCIKEIRRTLGDSSQQPRFIKTVPKSGYRFIGSVEKQPNGFRKVEVEKIINDSPAAENESLVEENASSAFSILELLNRRIVLVTLSILILAFSLTAFLGQTGWQNKQKSVEIALPQSTDKKSLAVMYFANQSNSPELEWLREGIADMLTTNLSRSPKLNVLSRQQFHALLERNGLHRGDELSFEQSIEIAKKSRATNFITGSFAKAGEKIRLDVQLYDASNGALAAAESLIADKPEQILTEIDLLSLKLAKHLGANGQENQNHIAEAMTDNLEAYRYYSLGVEKAQAFHNQEAIELLEKAVALDANFAMAHARIGYVYALSWGLAEKGKPHLERAFRLSERLTEKDRLSIAAWYATANLDYPNAIQAFREIVNRFPFETEAYWRLAKLQAGEEQMDEAVETLKQGLTIDAEAKDIYNTLGNTLSAMGRHDEARAAHERYVALAPDEPNAFDSLGLTYQWAGDYAAAIENYNRALELNPNFEVAVIHLANSRVQLGQYRAAIDLYRRYIAAAKSDTERLRGLDCIAEVYAKKQDFDSAEKGLKEARKIRKEPSWISYIVALESGGKVEATQLEEFLAAKTTYSERGVRNKQRFDLYLRGLAALKNGRTDEAIANFKEVVRRPPPVWNIDAHEDCLANAYLQTGQFDEAVAEYERILRLNPNYPLARFHLAEAFAGKNQLADAQGNYRLFLETWKDADVDIREIAQAKKSLNDL